jgi:energy-converting hydrogenase Eha subunit G
MSSQLVIGLVILGIGLTGLFGGAVAVSVSRRRKVATTRVDKQR